MAPKMKLKTLNLPVKYVEALDIAVKEGLAPNRSEAIRDAIRDYMHLHKLIEKIEVDANMLDKLENIE